MKGIIVNVAKRDAPGIIRAFNMGDTATSRETIQTNFEIYEALAEFRDCREVWYYKLQDDLIQYNTI